MSYKGAADKLDLKINFSNTYVCRKEGTDKMDVKRKKTQTTWHFTPLWNDLDGTYGSDGIYTLCTWITVDETRVEYLVNELDYVHMSGIFCGWIRLCTQEWNILWMN